MVIYYYCKKTSLSTVSNIVHQMVYVGDHAFGWIDWRYNPAEQSVFEQDAAILVVGPLMYSKISPEVASALSAHGVLSTDTVYEAVQKMRTKFGGFTMKA